MTARNIPIAAIGFMLALVVVLAALNRCGTPPEPPESPLIVEGMEPRAYLPLVGRGCPTCPPCATNTPPATLRPTPTPRPTDRPTPTPPPPTVKGGVAGGSATSDVGGSCERAARLGAWARREWGAENKPTCTNGVKTILNVWGRGDATLYADGSRSLPAGDTDIYLLMNECCGPGCAQCDLTPYESAVLSRAIIARYPQYRFGTPSHYQASASRVLLETYEAEFGAGSAARDFDFLDIHIYGYAAEYNIQRFEEFLALADQYGFDEIVISETQIAVEKGNEAWAVEQTRLWLAYLEAHPRVVSYFWFCTACQDGWYPQLVGGRLINPNTEEITPFGWAFIEAGQ
jgi:hypothetical protein